MTLAQKRKNAKLIIAELEKAYPDAQCSLSYAKPHELLIATRLAAQCTDARVNIVTKDLFERYKTIDDFANAEISDVESYVKSCGLYKTKAKDIVLMCRELKERFNGELPDTIEELTTLPGVGRKTANLIVGDIFRKPAVVVDTHCIRLTNLMGLTTGKNPSSVEKQLREILPMDKANNFCHRLVLHGRKTCVANRPACKVCELYSICEYGISQKNKE